MPAPRIVGDLSKDRISKQGHILRYWSDDVNARFGGKILSRLTWNRAGSGRTGQALRPINQSDRSLIRLRLLSRSPPRGPLYNPLPRPSPKKLPNDCDFPIGMLWSPAGWLFSSGSEAGCWETFPWVPTEKCQALKSRVGWAALQASARFLAFSDASRPCEIITDFTFFVQFILPEYLLFSR